MLPLALNESSVVHDPDYIAICNAIFPWIFERLDINSLEKFNSLKAQSITNIDLDIRYEMEIMTTVDRHLRHLINKLYGPVLFLQFPANIRVASSEVPHDYLDKPYVTDRVHCDCWSQAPQDSFNLFLYLHYLPRRPCLDFFSVPESEFPALCSYKGPYASAPKFTFTKINTTARSGQLLIFPTHTPHQTNRGDFGLRISLDARFRPIHSGFKATPLFEDILKDNWLENRMTSLGVYWLSSDRDLFLLSRQNSRGACSVSSF